MDTEVLGRAPRVEPLRDPLVSFGAQPGNDRCRYSFRDFCDQHLESTEVADASDGQTRRQVIGGHFARYAPRAVVALANEPPLIDGPPKPGGGVR